MPQQGGPCYLLSCYLLRASLLPALLQRRVVAQLRTCSHILLANSANGQGMPCMGLQWQLCWRGPWPM